MDLDLSGRVAIVTGGSKGIGKATAMLLAREGCRVSICGRRKEALEKAAEEVSAQGAEALPLQADVTNPEDLCRLVEQTVARFGRIDVLVNNAGGAAATDKLRQRTLEGLDVDIRGTSWRWLASLEKTNLADWRFGLEANVLAVLQLSLLVVPHMKRNGWGRIVNIASIAGREKVGAWRDYNVAKAALISLSSCMASEWARDGITVNAVCPGSVYTDQWEGLSQVLAERMGIAQAEVVDNFAKANLPLGRFATPEEIANLVVFLASEPARLVNGAAIAVDGGQSRYMFS